MDKTYAFLDEYGNHDLDTTKSGVSGYFILSAVIVSEQHVEALRAETESLRKRYFQTGEIKSSGVGNKHKRRVSILKSISDLDFKFYALVVDKARINKDSGYQYKKSFLKNINGKIYNHLFTKFNDVHIVADEHGSEEYKLSFKNYIEKYHKPDLFYKSKFDLVTSTDNVLVQLSDFLVGSIAKVYEKKAPQELKEIYLGLIKEKCLGIDEWPTKYQVYFPPENASDKYDQLVLTHSLSSAELFIEKNESTNDEDIKLQIAVARFLVFQLRWIDQESYIRTSAIQQHLEELGHGNVNDLRLRSKIIAKLRDSDVIISSSSKGYKIPSSFRDMEIFVETVNSKITPLLERLGRARQSLSMASKGDIDILNGPKYPHLVSFIEALEKRSV